MTKLKTTFQGISLLAFLVMAGVNAFNRDWANTAVAISAAVLVSI
jgi:hypothetical protein